MEKVASAAGPCDVCGACLQPSARIPRPYAGNSSGIYLSAMIPNPDFRPESQKAVVQLLAMRARVGGPSRVHEMMLLSY